MVSFSPVVQPLNFTHMYEFTDYRNKPSDNKLCTTPGSIFEMLYKDKRFTKFREIVERAKMVGQFNSKQADCTVFVVPDKHLTHIPEDFFKYMDDGMARQILSASTLNRRIDSELLTSTPVAYYWTKNPEARMYITNISGVTRINQTAKVIQFDINRTNGTVHVIDDLLVPTENSYLS